MEPTDNEFWLSVALVALDYAIENSPMQKSAFLGEGKLKVGNRYPVTLPRIGKAKAKLRGEEHTGTWPKNAENWLANLWSSIEEHLLPKLTNIPAAKVILTAAFDAAKDPRKRSNFDSSQLQTILEHAGLRRPSANAPVDVQMPSPLAVPEWLVGSDAAPLFVNGLPPIRRTTAAARAKARLYGGDPRTEYTALQHVSLGHHFPRSTVSELATSIKEQSESCCTFTLKSEPGGGLTLALAHLVKLLSDDPTIRVFSVLGDAKTTAKVIRELNQTHAEELYTWANSQGEQLGRIVLIFDDLSAVAGSELGNIDRFLAYLEGKASSSTAAQLAFVFGSHVENLGHDLHGEITLQLTQEDCSACYVAMAETQPRIINAHLRSWADLFREQVPARDIKSEFGNDVQALIDFILEHGEPLTETKKYWLANIEGFTGSQRDPLRLTAVAELLGLSVPRQLACEIFNLPHSATDLEIEKFVATDRRLVWAKGDWWGIGLSCPRRARSMLNRAGQLAPKDVSNDLESLFGISVSIINIKAEFKKDGFAFIRHMLQRLGNRYNFLIWSNQNIKILIGRRILYKYLRVLDEKILPGDAIDLSKWCGTISSYLIKMECEYIEFETENSLDFEEVVSPSYLKDVDGRIRISIFARLIDAYRTYLQLVLSGQLRFAPEDAVPIARAARRILRFDKCLAERRRLSGSLTNFFSLQRMRDVIIRQIEFSKTQKPPRSDCSRRANELVHAFGRLLEEIPAGRRRNRRKRAAASLRYFCCLFDRKGVEPDAGVWIARAQLTGIGGAMARATNSRRWKRFVERAKSCIEANPFSQAGWQSGLDKELERAPAFEGVSGDG